MKLFNLYDGAVAVAISDASKNTTIAIGDSFQASSQYSRSPLAYISNGSGCATLFYPLFDGGFLVAVLLGKLSSVAHDGAEKLTAPMIALLFLVILGKLNC